jgi:hypothetical protein
VSRSKANRTNGLYGHEVESLQCTGTRVEDRRNLNIAASTPLPSRAETVALNVSIQKAGGCTYGVAQSVVPLAVATALQASTRLSTFRKPAMRLLQVSSRAKRGFTTMGLRKRSTGKNSLLPGGTRRINRCPGRKGEFPKTGSRACTD